MGMKLLYLPEGLSEAFSSPLISFHLSDLFIGIIAAALIRFAVYVKGKNAKKYRKGTEYGSARCPGVLQETYLPRLISYPEACSFSKSSSKSVT